MYLYAQIYYTYIPGLLQHERNYGPTHWSRKRDWRYSKVAMPIEVCMLFHENSSKPSIMNANCSARGAKPSSGISPRRKTTKQLLCWAWTEGKPDRSLRSGMQSLRSVGRSLVSDAGREGVAAWDCLGSLPPVFQVLIYQSCYMWDPAARRTCRRACVCMYACVYLYVCT